MGKNKKKDAVEQPQKVAGHSNTAPEAEVGTGDPIADAPLVAPEGAKPITTATSVSAKSRFRRLFPDLLKVGAAAVVIAVAMALWYQPPLLSVGHPYVSYLFEGKEFKDAKLYRPIAMPTRFYVELPRRLADRYHWFAIDRRREVAALAEEPRRHMAGKRAIRRSDPLGLDLEFRKLDRSEWQVHFLDESIIFSNAVLCVRLDLNEHNQNGQK